MARDISLQVIDVARVGPIEVLRNGLLVEGESHGFVL